MSTLQELLNIGLVDIGSDDSRFDKMLSASSALSEKFNKDPSLLITATLISLDEGVNEDDSMFTLVEELVVSEWKTLRNTHVNRPRELLRSIIINALTDIVQKNHYAAGVVWNSAVSQLRHRQVHLGKAASIIEKLLTGAGRLAEQEVVSQAEPLPTLPKKNTSQEKFLFNNSATIDNDDVYADVARSAGPQQIEDLDDPNPYWPAEEEQWAKEFTNLMTTALVKAVNVGNARFSETLSEQLSAFGKQLTEQFENIEQLRSGILQTHESNRMRLEVLWWSKALYSPALQAGYRELDLPIAAVAAAVDISNIVPALAPASVCYVLGETLHRISQLKNDDTKKSIQAYLEGVTGAKTELGDQLPVPTDNTRLPLVDLVSEAAKGSRISHDEVRQRTGVDPTLVLSSSDFAMWVFRGIQANRLVEELR